jgi:hypothetical protein
MPNPLDPLLFQPLPITKITEAQLAPVFATTEIDSVINDLQQICQKYFFCLPTYSFQQFGPDHDLSYLCTVTFSNMTYNGSHCSNKKSAKKSAARTAIFHLRDFLERASNPNKFVNQEKPMKQMKKEQHDKSEQGVISGVATSLSKLGHTLASFPIIGGLASSASAVLDKTTPMLRQLGLDYPPSTQAAQPIIVRQTSSLSHVKGLDSVELLAADPTNQVSNDMSFFCESVPSSVFANYKLRPGLIRVAGFDGTYTQNQLIVALPVNPLLMHQVANNYYALHPVANIATQFRYWRGGMKFMGVATTSRQVAGRIRIEWHPDYSTIATMTNASSGDVVSLTVDINGDTNFCFTVPYLKDTPYLPIPTPVYLETIASAGPCCNGFIAIRVITPPVVSNSEADSQIDLAIFTSGAEDLTFARPSERPTGWAYQTTMAGAEKAMKQMAKSSCSLQTEFQKIFTPLAPSSFAVTDNILQGEVISSWPELFHRYTSVDALTTPNEQLTYFDFNPWMTSLR